MKVIKLILVFFVLFNNVRGQVNCLPSSKIADLDINNIKARITNGSLLWQNAASSEAGYFSNQDSAQTTIYAGNFGIGGLDASSNLHFSGATFENSTFYPGPIKTATASTEDSYCSDFDRVWKINRWEVEEFVLQYQDLNYTIPEVILSWPAHGNTGSGYAQNLAPFHDSNNDGIYNPYDGDYPEFDLTGTMACGDIIYGDQCIYWIINDVGNNQSPNSLGVEIHMQAFAYLGGESINTTTFYRYKIINRSGNNYSDSYFANWTDSDIGCSQDDYVGCEVQRGMGYGINADPIDNDGCNVAAPYGSAPPAIGIDFVKGPLAIAGDGIDNNRDGNIDELNETYSLSTFMYFAGNLPPNVYGHPTNDLEYYNYMKAIWIDGTHMTYGGSGYGGVTPTTFAFPDDSDLINWYGTGGVNAGGAWSELTVATPKGDRRMLNAVGPFDLYSGETEVITYSVISARDIGGTNLTSLDKLKLADDTIQLFSDGCYGQTCAQLTENFVYSNDSTVFHFAYEMDANTYSWDFGDGNTSSTRFPSNTYATSGTFTVCLTATNSCSSISLCKDIYVDANFHNSLAFDITRIEGMGNAGRELEISQTSIDSMFILGNNFIKQPVYESYKAPILIEAIDLDSIISGNYLVQFDGVDSSANWKMYREGAIDTVYSNLTIGSNNKQIIPQWGIAVTVQHYSYKNNMNEDLTSPITSEITATGTQWLTGLSDNDGYSAENWIAAGALSINCDIVNYPDVNADPCRFNDVLGVDNYEEYEQLTNGFFAPYRLTRSKNHWPISTTFSSTQMMNDLSAIQSIDIVFTPDTSKWSRSPIFEMHDASSQTIGNAIKQELRLSPSVDKLGNSDGTGMGMGWFPGYAINVETGERLNIGFGEDSYHAAENGTDMLFNPTTAIYDANGDTVFGGKHYVYVFRNTIKDGSFNPLMPNYDEANYIESNIAGSFGGKLKVWRSCTWVGIPLLKSGESLLSSENKIRIRVKKPLQNYGYTISDTINATMPMYGAFIDASISSVNNQKLFEVKVFPNPTETNLTFQLKGNKERYNIEIFDITGKIYKSEMINTSSTTINVSDLSKGIYLYYIYNKDGSKLSKGKFIKQ